MAQVFQQAHRGDDRLREGHRVRWSTLLQGERHGRDATAMNPLRSQADINLPQQVMHLCLLPWEPHQEFGVGRPVTPLLPHLVFFADQLGRQPFERPQLGKTPYVLLDTRAGGGKPSALTPAVFQVDADQFLQQEPAGIKAAGNKVLNPGGNAIPPGLLELLEEPVDVPLLGRR